MNNKTVYFFAFILRLFILDQMSVQGLSGTFIYTADERHLKALTVFGIVS